MPTAPASAHAEPTRAADAALVSAARGGDRAALARLHALYAPVIHGLLLARLQPADADDLTQDVFVTALRRLGSLRSDASFGAWLGTMARNAAATLQRRRRPRALDDSRPAPASAPGAPAEAAEALAAIRSLPDAYRETLMLRLVEGLTGPQIAARCGLTEGSVRVNLHRGMALLRERLAADHLAQEPSP